MIRRVENERFTVRFRDDYTTEIRDAVNGLGFVLNPDDLQEFREMIDYIWGTNDLYRYTEKYNGPGLAVSPFTSDKE